MIDNLETTLRHRVRLFRLLDNMLLGSDCEIESQITISKSVDPAEVQLHLAAIKLWLSDFVDGTIAYNPNTEDNTDWTELVDNGVILTPGNPLDHVMVALIHSKLRAIGGDIVNISKTQFFCDTSHGFSNTMCGDANDWLPTMTEWVGARSFHDKPWWHRSDASTVDLTPTADDDITVLPDFGGKIVDMMRDDYEPSTSTPSTSPTTLPHAEIIKPKFKPRVVTDDD